MATLFLDNEHLVAPFLEHYLRLGVSHIVLLDNGSRDSTAEKALRFERVTLVRCTLPFYEYEMDLKRFLIERYAEGCWCLAVDIDELFDYPGSDELPFEGFLGYLNEREYTAVVATMLDMFADGPIESWPEGDRELIEACAWYDLTGFYQGQYGWLKRVNKFADSEMPLYQGGIRAQAFGRKTTIVTKFPFLYYRRGGKLSLRAIEHATQGAHVADVSTVLRHYKFDRAFVERWRAAAGRGRHKVHIKEYAAALSTLDRNPDLVLRGPTARRLVHVNQLVDEGFLRASPAYWDYVRSHRSRKTSSVRAMSHRAVRP
ncbi:MAG: glycosyltransferase family 2 protein [Bryobacteraceae bacterium]|nr:glycosyltransferase family 2 protein [Bryobacteraceae bacterium]